MQLHEWMRYRDRHIKPTPTLADNQEVPAATSVEEEPLLEWGAAEVAPESREPEPEAERAAPAARPAKPRAQVRGLAQDVHAQDFQTRRLQTLLTRQQRLPLEMAEEPAAFRRDSRPEPKESREDLVQRLLDPVLSISETATLLGVCPTSIRRYTKRGLLKCFRTPGNQRRFRLADVLDFMERQQSLE